MIFINNVSKLNAFVYIIDVAIVKYKKIEPIILNTCHEGNIPKPPI